MTVLSASRAPAVVLGSDFNDPTNERIILLSAAGLAVVGLGLLLFTIMWWRRGRQEHPALAPLEVMSTRSWWKAPQGDRNRRLQKVRLAGHDPVNDEPIRAEPLDLQALVRSVPQAFDDLREPGEVAADAAVESPVAFAVAADGEVVAVTEPPVPESADQAEPVAVEPAIAEVAVPVAPAAPVPGVAIDVDATAFAAERPKLPVEPPPVPAPTNGVKAPEPEVNGQGPGALASSHGDQP